MVVGGKRGDIQQGGARQGGARQETKIRSVRKCASSKPGASTASGDTIAPSDNVAPSDSAAPGRSYSHLHIAKAQRAAIGTAATTVVGAGLRGLQVRKAGARAFIPAKQEAFFIALAETSNITAAAQSVGVDLKTIWRWRQKSAEFQRRWAQALAQGFADLEMRLLAQARFGAHSEVESVDDGAGTRRSKLRRDTPSHGRMLLTIHRQSVLAIPSDDADGDDSIQRAESTDQLIVRLRARLRDMAATPDDADAR